MRTGESVTRLRPAARRTGGSKLRAAARPSQRSRPQGRGAVGGVQAVLLAGHVIVNVVASAFFAAIEPVSLSHSCIHSDEVTAVDLDSGREQVGVTGVTPELNPATRPLKQAIPNECNQKMKCQEWAVMSVAAQIF